MGSLVGDALAQVDRAHENTDRLGLRSGLSELDRLTGGLLPGDLMLLAARPSIGKTALLHHMALHSAVDENRRVLLCTLRLSAVLTTLRLLCQRSGIDLPAVRGGFLSEADWPRLANAAGQLTDGRLLVYHPPGGASVRALTRTAQRLARDEGGQVELILVDGLEDLRVNRRWRLGECAMRASQQLKSLALRLGCPVVATSMLSPGPETREDPRPLLSDLSRSLDVFADFVVLLHRDEVYCPETFDRGVAELILAKNNGGPIGTARVRFQHLGARFRGMSDPRST